MADDDLLQAIRSAKVLATLYRDQPRWSSWRSPVKTVIGLLDDIEHRITTNWPQDMTDVRIGLYAIRNLEEMDAGRLSLELCRLDNRLKGR